MGKIERVVSFIVSVMLRMPVPVQRSFIGGGGCRGFDRKQIVEGR